MSTLAFVILTIIISVTSQTIDNEDISIGSNIFGYELTDELWVDTSTNLWISPFCISSCFSLIYPGSAGDTQTEIETVLQFPTTTSDTSDVTQQYFTLQSSIESTYDGIRDDQYATKPSIIGIANKVYASDKLTLKQSYINALYDTIRRESFIEQNFDFSAENASKIINRWVSDNTNGLIDGVLEENADLSSWRLAALNAIYLNASFADPFDTDYTSLQKFYTDITRTEEVDDIHLMHQFGYFPYYEDNMYQWLKFRFAGTDDLFVLFALPKFANFGETYTAGTVGAVNGNDRPGLNTDNTYINNVIDNLESKYMALALPKISIEEQYDTTLKSSLQNMGMVDAFSANLADFSGISDDDADLFIDTIIHKTMVEMNEDGLVAAAVTVIGIAITSIQIPPPATLFKADHPFQMYIIDGEHGNNTVLFMGQINNPGIPEGSDTPTYNESDDLRWTNYQTFTSTETPEMTTMDGLDMDTTMMGDEEPTMDNMAERTTEDDDGGDIDMDTTLIKNMDETSTTGDDENESMDMDMDTTSLYNEDPTVFIPTAGAKLDYPMMIVCVFSIFLAFFQ